MAAPSPDCLASLVGLSAGTNTCFALPLDANRAAAITASSTGRYVDQTEGLRLAPATGQNAAADLYARLETARNEAAVQVRAALQMGGAASYGPSIYQQRGTLGGMGNGALMPVGTRALLPFFTNYRREGAWRITRLQLYADQAIADAPLLLDQEPVGLLSTSGASGLTTGLPAGGLVIPLDGNQHTLEVVLPEGVRVRANNFFSGCFGCQQGTPWFSSVIGRRQASGGYFGGSLYNIEATTPGNGFSVSVVEECTADPDFLCFASGSDDDQSSPRYPALVTVLALAVQYKAAALFINSLIPSQAVGRYTMLEPKALPELRDYYESKLVSASPDGTGNYLAWLRSPAGLGQVRHPCFAGPPVRGPGMVWTG